MKKKILIIIGGIAATAIVAKLLYDKNMAKDDCEYYDDEYWNDPEPLADDAEPFPDDEGMPFADNVEPVPDETDKPFADDVEVSATEMDTTDPDENPQKNKTDAPDEAVSTDEHKKVDRKKIKKETETGEEKII